MDNNELGALRQADRAFVPDGIEPVPVSPVPASIPSVDDIGPETTRLHERLIAQNTERFHVSWGPDAHKLTSEERAATINAMMDEMDHPLTGLAGRLEGEAFLKRDTVMCTRQRHQLVDGEFVAVPPTKGEESLLRSLESAAKTLEEAGKRLREIALTQGIEARQGQDAQRLDRNDESPVAESDAPDTAQRIATIIHDVLENDDDSGGGGYLRAAHAVLATVNQGEAEILRSHIAEQIKHVENRIQDGKEMGATVWRIALEDIVRENTAVLASLSARSTAE